MFIYACTYSTSAIHKWLDCSQYILQSHPTVVYIFNGCNNLFILGTDKFIPNLLIDCLAVGRDSSLLQQLLAARFLTLYCID
jgi:hypothetical protein